MNLQYFKWLKDEKQKKFYKNRPDFDLTREVYQCPSCKTLLQSMYRHDWVTCPCYGDSTGIFVDGGNSYGRFGGHDVFNIITINPKDYNVSTTEELIKTIENKK